MRLLKGFVAVVLATTLAGTAWSQSAVSSGPGILGYLNPATNSFQPLSMQTLVVNPGAVSVATGTIVTKFTISVKSKTVTSSTPITCNISATVLDFGSGGSNSIAEYAAVTATRPSSTSATCTVTIPYSWNLYNRSTDRIQLNYILFAASGGVQAFNLAARTSTQSIPPITTIPVNGATTNETVDATI